MSPIRLFVSQAVFALLVVTASAASPPNILFIFSDDHAPAAIGAYGSKINQTPNLDRIANAQYEPENEDFKKRMKAGELSEKDVVRWKYQRYIKDYLRCVQAVDDSVGELLKYLDDSGLADNTIVIYSSDQGFYLGEHGWYDKRWMFEESLKMPFLIRWPGVVQPGGKSDALIQNIDYGPTFLDVAGAEVPHEMQGRSLVPLLRKQGKPNVDWRDAIYYAYYENAAVHNVPVHDGVRNDRYKLMYFARDRSWNLFDLKNDPQELKSVHDDPNYAQVLAAMKKRYQDLRQLYDVNTAVIPATRGDEPNWKKRDASITRQAKKGNVDLAFIGDSITQGWEGAGKQVWQQFYSSRKAINLGIGGDRTEHLIWRLTHGNLGKIKPKVAVLMIGTNNTGHLMQDPEEIAAGIAKILEILQEQLPQTKVVLHGVFPRGKDSLDPGRLNNIAVNDIIRGFADGDRVHYANIADQFLELDGTISDKIMPDALHLSAEGYQRWAKALESQLIALGLSRNGF